MAAVTSLGLHQPTALQYAVQEQIIDENATRSDYTWETFVNHDGHDICEDELLVTKDAVIWSRGNIFRKCFGFKLEKETVTQALLTYFPTSEQSPQASAQHEFQPKRSSDGRILSKALVVFLKTQAHVYFLDGSSHVVHMPFEVESACAAPQGVIIQRKQRNDFGYASSLKFPRVPPNSFISPQTSPVSMRNSQQSTFTTETLGRPKALPLRLNNTVENMWDIPNEKEDSHWPRLVSLTDPLLDMGLVVTQPDKNNKQKSRRTSGRSPCFLNRAEEILHVEEIPVTGTTSTEHAEPLALAVTINRESSMYTVWRFTYLPREDPFRAPKATKKKGDRRRSSMQPGLPSGVTSPVQPSFQESFGATLPGKRTRKSEKQDKADKALENLESSLGLDKDAAAGRRTSRRVSSMLARADLSASQDRTAFGDQPQVANHTGGRRETSYGSSRVRTSGAFSAASFGGQVTQSTNILGSFLEAPVDNLLEELRAGGDFEGFHNMGLDDHDFDGLTREILFTKVHSVPVDNSNVRYSLSKTPAREHCRVFCIAGPRSIVDEHNRRQILIGVQDSMEKRLQLLTLHLQVTDKAPSSELGRINVTFGQLRKAQKVIDCCKIVDQSVSMILVLSESTDGTRELSLQAPWSELTSVYLPPKLSLANMRSLDERGGLATREVGLRRAVTPVVGEIAGIQHPKLNGVVDILDGESKQLHQIRIQLRPTRPEVAKIFDVLGAFLPSSVGDRLLAGWWHIMIWLRKEEIEVVDVEWSAFVIQLMTVYMALGYETQGSPKSFSTPVGHRRNRSLLRSSSGAQIDLSDWDAMNLAETPNFAAHPSWIENRGWEWVVEEDAATSMFEPSQGRQEELSFFVAHLKYAQTFMASNSGETAYGQAGYIPTAEGNAEASRVRSARDILTGLHWLLEEQKLNISGYHLIPPSSADLRALVLQIAKWLRWNNWVMVYDLEMPMDFSETQGSLANAIISRPIPEPPLWNVLEWAQTSLTQADSPLTLPPGISAMPSDVLPQTRLLGRLFEALRTKRKSPVDFVEAMYDSGITPANLESFPETILVPLQDAISQCQTRPPPTWSRTLLELVDRGDVGSVLSPLDGSQLYSSSLAASSHLSSWDFSSLCQNVMDFNDAPADDTAESDKQAVIRSIFKEDRRLEETRLMLNTTKPRAVRLDPLPEWSEPFYLEQQKELVTRLATNTLSIPAGRGLLNYGLRFPLLTQKYHINGFVLNCIVKPTNVTVGVDKSLFTEEKIAWAFFHSGVAAGLSISRQAKGVDTSWILYNKPGNDLNNRHAGFLLALGLNGHLKGLAKWVAFKYLTPKHTMTSIGLLLGLAASYIGTMDSLITRLLSVHVTRMLPRGAAELNLSPLTQTTGIMGIGLLYCNSQHRRMSEIMMSEIKHVETEDEEEPLRSECYRLAAGFALGFINLGKGTDLKGLHDMRITEQLLSLASSTKNIELVHILDRSSAAAIMAIALIYMKSEDHIVARKIDVPDAMLQFDYIRPDILLLRTVAKHLILWSEIKPTHSWIRRNLPARYQSRINPPTQPFDNSAKGPLNTTHLPFLTILAGLCYAVALRYAGSGDTHVRDLLLVYLQRFYGYCRSTSPKANFDDRTVHVTARMCLDIVALSTATVMAGTCDLKVLRIIRSLHARNDTETTYGSHMATHMAIGVLSLGCGTQTFNTSNLAIAALLVAFYPVFPDQVQDNKSHLQAFRHFWVLATDPRCLVTKDVATNTPVSVPIVIKFRGGRPDEIRNTPCLLPPLDDIVSVRTDSPEYWNVDLDFAGAKGAEVRGKFEKYQILYLRKRPAGGSPFSATMLALGRQAPSAISDESVQPLEWLFDAAPTLARLTHAERDIALDSGIGGPDVGLSKGSVVDARLVLEESINSGRRDELIGLKGLFEWIDWKAAKMDEDTQENKGMSWDREGWLRESIIEGLKGKVWLAGRESE